MFNAVLTLAPSQTAWLGWACWLTLLAGAACIQMPQQHLLFPASPWPSKDGMSRLEALQTAHPHTIPSRQTCAKAVNIASCQSSRWRSQAGHSTFVDPLIGTAGPDASTYEPDSYAGLSPNPSPPFAAVRVTPSTRTNYVSSEGYYYHDKTYRGTLMTRQPAIWMGDLAPLEVSAGFGQLQLDEQSRALPFSHEEESASLGKHALRVDASRQQRGAGFYVQSAGRSHSSIIEYDLWQSESQHGTLVDGPYVAIHAAREGWRGAVFVDADRQEISGWTPERMDYKLGPHQAPNFRGYFVSRIESEAGWLDWGTARTQHNSTQTWSKQRGRWNEDALAGWVKFTPNTTRVLIKTGLSLISIDQARRNLESELSSAQDVDDIALQNTREWDAALSVVETEGGNLVQKRVLYTGLHRTLQFPSLHSESADEGSAYYSLYTDSVHKGEAYQSYSIWDTWRAAWAMQILFANHRVGSMVSSMLDMYLQSGKNGEPGYLPMWANGAETNIMISTWADSLIAEAFAKKVTGFNRELALESVLKDASVPPEFDEILKYEDREEFTPIEARAGLTSYASRGWVAHDRTAESVSRTLDYAACDAAVAIVASHMSDQSSAAIYRARAKQNYLNVYNNATGFFAPRFANGSFFEAPLQNPKARDDGFTEGNRWTYLFDVVHDLPGLVRLHGSRMATLQKLDDYFEGGYNDHSNEPSHHVPVLYAALGRPDKSAKIIRDIAQAEYTDLPDGYKGNEDLGQMSSWYTFISAFGFYPLYPASAKYVVVGDH
ncbi:hypothetical protein IE81DRAFT_6250 [Ceraceosorus guamensis]|uniref:Glycoside hydrolase family 92 protein n=1 Tax=Ceraceosorus guamensis TaxID=1522189 RepID=A0A316W919_9BASI|nr:hypothetical protein IE81DRAFT_6250 [Ceraceosorus guamensis]PWN46379.1 hypothetical protein IE81DRAFT_6250 [Ceraceosorus guamensis]